MNGVNREKLQVNTNGQPACFTLYFKEAVPRLVIFGYDTDTGKKYYMRYIHNAVDAVMMRFPVTPKNLTIELVTENPIESTSMLKTDCTPRKIQHEVPHQVNRGYGLKDLKWVYVDTLDGGTPAKHIVSGPEKGTIYFLKSNEDKYPQQINTFIRLHEAAHTFFDDEDKADEWAFHEYMRLGYNTSGAEWALIHILRKTAENVDRIVKMYKTCCAFDEKYN